MRCLLGVLLIHGLAGPALGGEDCVTRAVEARMVRVRVERGWCSGVLVDARTVRTAGHCLTLGGKVEGLRSPAGAVIEGRLESAYYGPAYERLPSRYDVAELRADRDLGNVAQIPIVDPRTLAQNTAVTVAGFAMNQPLALHEMTFVRRTRFRWWILGYTSYELTAPDGWTTRPGDSGGPVFLVDGCALTLVGTVTDYAPKARYSTFDPIYDMDSLPR